MPSEVSSSSRPSVVPRALGQLDDGVAGSPAGRRMEGACASSRRWPVVSGGRARPRARAARRERSRAASAAPGSTRADATKPVCELVAQLELVRVRSALGELREAGLVCARLPPRAGPGRPAPARGGAPAGRAASDRRCAAAAAAQMSAAAAPGRAARLGVAQLGEHLGALLAAPAALRARAAGSGRPTGRRRAAPRAPRRAAARPPRGLPPRGRAGGARRRARTSAPSA